MKSIRVLPWLLVAIVCLGAAELAVAQGETPFSCDNIRIATRGVGWQAVELSADRLRVELENSNDHTTRLMGVHLFWRAIRSYPRMFPRTMALEDTIYWINEIGTTDIPLDTNATPNYVPGVEAALDPDSSITWQLRFQNGPPGLGEFVGIEAFEGTTWYFENPNTPGSFCAITFELPPPPAQCQGSIYTSSAIFEPFGIVRFELYNFGLENAVLDDFSIRWIQTDLTGQVRLRRIWFGGTAPELGAGSRILWTASSADQDNAPFTVKSEGAWSGNAILPAKHSANVWLDFDGTGVATLAAVGMTPSQFNGTTFAFIYPDVRQCSTPPRLPTLTPSPTLSAPNAAPAGTFYEADESIELRWNRVTWARAQHFQLGSSPTFARGTLLHNSRNLSPSLTMTTLGALPPGTYFWRVRARRANGTWGEWSRVGTFTVGSIYPTAIP